MHWYEALSVIRSPEAFKDKKSASTWMPFSWNKGIAEQPGLLKFCLRGQDGLVSEPTKMQLIIFTSSKIESQEKRWRGLKSYVRVLFWEKTCQHISSCNILFAHAAARDTFKYNLVSDQPSHWIILIAIAYNLLQWPGKVSKWVLAIFSWRIDYVLSRISGPFP